MVVVFVPFQFTHKIKQSALLSPGDEFFKRKRNGRFFVRSPLTFNALSSSCGLIDKLVAMGHLSHNILHRAAILHELLWTRHSAGLHRQPTHLLADAPMQTLWQITIQRLARISRCQIKHPQENILVSAQDELLPRKKPISAGHRRRPLHRNRNLIP
jgi:hypothetical protein